MSQTIDRVPRWRLVLYSFGNFGWMMTSFCMAVVINYFYFPPVIDGTTTIPELITREPIFMGLTVLGLVLAISRIFDAISNPIIANMSDRSNSRFGRRKFYMMISILPFAITSVLIFIPPDDNPSQLNAIWLGGCSILAYLFLTMYAVPYTALIPELGKTAADRIFIATCNSLAWAVAFGVGQLIWIIKDLFEGIGMTPMEAIRTCAIIFAVLGVIAMLVPIIVIDENRYRDGNSCRENVWSALGSAFKNKDFVNFTIANAFTYMALFFLETGVIYYVTMLLGMPESYTSTIMIAMFVCSFALYPLIIKLTHHFQKRNLLLFSFILNGILFALIPAAAYSSNPEIVGIIVVMLIALPTAINSILPTAMLADIAKADGIRTGSHKEGVFFGAMNFSVKMAITLTTLLFPSIIIIGSTDGSPTVLGVQITAIIGMVLSFAACLFLYRYDEHRINNDLNEPTLTVQPE